MTYEILTTDTSAPGGDGPTRVEHWSGNRELLVRELAVKHKLGANQRQQLLARGRCQVMRQGLTYRLEVSAFVASGKNALKDDPPVIVKLTDGQEVNWCSLTDEARDTIKSAAPAVFEECERLRKEPVDAHA